MLSRPGRFGGQPSQRLNERVIVGKLLDAERELYLYGATVRTCVMAVVDECAFLGTGAAAKACHRSVLDAERLRVYVGKAIGFPVVPATGNDLPSPDDGVLYAQMLETGTNGNRLASRMRRTRSKKHPTVAINTSLRTASLARTFGSCLGERYRILDGGLLLVGQSLQCVEVQPQSSELLLDLVYSNPATCDCFDSLNRPFD
jgi:hypothetical protein